MSGHDEKEPPKRKNRAILLLLATLLGLVGADRFYLGKYGTGVLKAITLGGFGLWYYIDIMNIIADAYDYTYDGDYGRVKDVNGNTLKYGMMRYRKKNGEWVKDWFT